MAKVPFNHNIDEEVKKLLDEAIREIPDRFKIYECVEGALRLFCAMPPEVQIRLMHPLAAERDWVVNLVASLISGRCEGPSVVQQSGKEDKR